MIVINSSTRQFNIPGADMTFGVEADAGSERKYFQCPRYVGNNLDLMGSFVRLNYRNANGEVDSYLVEDMTVDGDNVLFSWELSPKVTAYKGQIRFVLCVVGPDTKVAWHTTLGTGVVLEGLEPEAAVIQNGTIDVVAQLIAMVNQQTGAVKAEGANQIKAVQTAAKTAETASVAEIEAKGVNVRESIPDDYTSLENTVDSLVRGRAGAIVCEVAGSAVVVKDTSNQPMCGLRIFGKSTQNGVPTPDAPVEIKSVVEPVVTVAGKNLLPKIKNVTYSGIEVVVNEDGTANVNGTANDQFTLTIGTKMPNLYGGYVLSGTPVDVGTRDCCLIVGYFGDNGWISESYDTGSGVVVKDANYAPYIGFSLLIRKGVTVNNALFKPMLSKDGGEYEPYKALQPVSITHTLPGIPVTSGGNYTDSDGQQWISDEVDLERGVYVQRCMVVELDGENHSFYTGQHTNGQYYIGFSNFEVARNSTVISSHYKSAIWSNNNGEVYCSNDVVILTDNRFTRVSKAKEHLAESPVTLLCMLETPIETPLSETEIAAYRAMHTNYPNTTVLNDAGAHMVVKYAADTKLYIDNKIKEALK